MSQLNDTDPMPFGKYKGMPMQDVPANYLHYLWTNGLRDQTHTSNVAHYIQLNMNALQQENKDLIWE